ncbi:unknown [Bacteroides sp. CAG:462]|nr:unknown [Bacteroides sp. CAG:462]
MSFLAPKYDLVDSEALLGRFAKYRLMQEGVLERHFEVDWERWVSFFCFRFLMLLFLLPSDLLTAPFF